MKACAFDYERPKDVESALRFLAAENSKILAGGQSLGPMLNLRLVQPALLVDMRSIAELKEVSEDRDSVTLGACVTHAAIEDGRVPHPTGPTMGFMREIAGNIAYRAVRNRGTIGGSLAHADPAADWPSALSVLGATVLIAGPGGRREIPMDRFFTGLFETVLTPHEILIAVRLPRWSKAARYGYWKFCRKAGEFPQAIGAALDDPERGVARAVIGATRGAPHLVADAKTLFVKPEKEALLQAVDTAGLAADAHNRQLHAVALRRAIEKMAA